MLDKKTSLKILKEIKKAKHILLALHVSPDEDSMASVLAMERVLKRLGKKTKIISFGQIPRKLQFMPSAELVEVADLAKINFNDFDLFIALDSAQERMITRSPFPQELPKTFKIINIDHHVTNTRFGDVNLVEPISSVAEILYWLFKIWEVKIDKKIAQLLFFGIVSDTGCFQYPLTSPETLKVGADLLESGASLAETILVLFRSYPLNTLKYWGKILENMQLDESGKFVWSKIGKEECRQLGVNPEEIAGAACLFTPVVSGTEFGIILNEESENLIRGSMRSRSNFDVSQIAVELGGGGHKQAAGFSLNMSLEEAEKKVLETARKILNFKLIREGV